MRKAVIIGLCLSLTLISGCWDLLILEDLAFIFAMSVDRVEDDPELILVSATNPALSPESSVATAKLIVRGYSITQAMMNMQNQRERIVVMGKVRVIIFGMDTVDSQQLINSMRELDQRRDMNPLSWVCLVRGDSAQKVLYLEPTHEQRVAIYLEDLLVRASDQGRLPKVTISQFWRDYSIAGITPVVPVIEIAEEEDGVVLVGLALINEQGKLGGVLNDAELLPYMLLTGRIRRGRFYTKISYQEQHNRAIKGLIPGIDSNVRVRLVDGKPEIDIQLDVTVDTLDVDMSFDDHLDEDIFFGVETALARDFQGAVEEIMRKSQEWRVDPTGIGQYARVQNPDWFRGRDWIEEFSQATVNVQVRVTVKNMGTLTNPRY